jgi:hypothetical protein
MKSMRLIRKLSQSAFGLYQDMLPPLLSCHQCLFRQYENGKWAQLQIFKHHPLPQLSTSASSGLSYLSGQAFIPHLEVSRRLTFSPSHRAPIIGLHVVQ